MSFGWICQWPRWAEPHWTAFIQLLWDAQRWNQFRGTCRWGVALRCQTWQHPTLRRWPWWSQQLRGQLLKQSSTWSTWSTSPRTTPLHTLHTILINSDNSYNSSSYRLFISLHTTLHISYYTHTILTSLLILLLSSPIFSPYFSLRGLLVLLLSSLRFKKPFATLPRNCFEDTKNRNQTLAVCQPLDNRHICSRQRHPASGKKERVRLCWTMCWFRMRKTWRCSWKIFGCKGPATQLWEPPWGQSEGPRKSEHRSSWRRKIWRVQSRISAMSLEVVSWNASHILLFNVCTW